MKITIHKAHGEVIEQRLKNFAQLSGALAQFEAFRIEDKRTTDALVKAAGFNPDDYSSYTLVREGDVYLLDLQEKPSQGLTTRDDTSMVPAPAEPVKHVNGAA